MDVIRNKKKEQKLSKDQTNVSVIDKERVERAQLDFDTFNNTLAQKKYKVNLESNLTDYTYTFLKNVKFVGYEAYALKEIFTAINDNRTEKNKLGLFEIDGYFKPEIIEALFYFIKKYEGVGFEEAILFKEFADVFATTMNEINADRENLRNLSLELIAAEQGVTVENLREQYEQSQENQ